MKRNDVPALTAQVDHAIEELEKLAREGRKDARDALDRIRVGQSIARNAHLWELAKRGEKERGIFSPEREIYDQALEATERLLWIAENKPRRLERVRSNHSLFPVLYGIPLLEQRYKKAWDSLGEKGSNLPYVTSRKTKPDALFLLARNAVEYLTRRHDSFIWIYFEKFARSDIGSRSIDDIREKFGAFTRTNWKQWEPVFENYITLKLAPVWERWNRLPDRAKANAYIASRFFTFDEWIKLSGNKRKLGTSEQNLERLFSENAELRLSIEDFASDPTIAAIQKRSEDRNCKFTEHRQAFLVKCRNLAKK